MLATEKYKILEEYFPDLLQGISEIIQKGKLSKRFNTLLLDANKKNELIKAKELCELKILELWHNQDDEKFKILCSVYFDISTLLNFDIKTEEDIYEVIKLISLGYLGEHSHFVKDFLNLQKQKIEDLIVTDKWNSRLLNNIFKVIVSLVIKKSWKDISQAIELINELRNEQKEFEENYLNQLGEESQPYGAAELVSLYHFAKTSEILGQYLLEGKTPNNDFDIENKVKYHLRIAKEFANASGNIILELLYQYVEAFSIKLITSDKGRRQIDLVFDALMSHPDSTDREIQAIIKQWGYEIEISAVSACRADIEKAFPQYTVRSVGTKKCSITNTEKQAWRIVPKTSNKEV